MLRKRLLWQIYPTYVFVTLIPLVAMAFYTLSVIHDHHVEQTAEQLKYRAILIADHLEGLPMPLQSATVDTLCKRFGQQTATRVTVILAPSGVVLGDSDRDPSTMENHAGREEIRQAMQGEIGRSTRYSDTVRRRMMYVGYPLRTQGEIVAVVRASMPLTVIDDALDGLYVRVGVAVGVALLMAAMLSFIISQSISKPLEEMRVGAERFARGDFDFRLSAPESDELTALAEAMNSMAAQLSERMQAIKKQRGELEAVLSSMVEGVLAIDPAERIMWVNRAAADLLEVDEEKAKGRMLQEAVRNPKLQEFVAAALASAVPIDGDLVLQTEPERYIQATGMSLKAPEGGTAGVLIVLNDVTRIRQLESVRRDFVANVSHELKTPITSIKGFVETLMDGAAARPEDLQRFLTIIAKQADRLNSIINDILSLSRLEHEAERNQVELAPGPVVAMLKDALEVCADRAAEKRIALSLECPEGLLCRMNAALLEQAVVNLIDNAVKYSGEGTRVEVAAFQNADQVVITVRDQGPGIAKEHQDRIFERFYRVDKGRSRQLGGTGLGLAIVRHIALAHQGSVAVESEPGKGCAFFVRLPAA